MTTGPRTRRTVLHRAGLALLGAAVLLGATAGGPAYAEDGDNGASIDHVETGDGTVQLLVSVPGADAVNLDSVTASVAGAPADATAEDAASTDEVERTTVLAIDASNSMRGDRIAAAKAAAAAYLDAVPANVRVGVVTFADTVDELVSPTLDRETARTAVEGITLSAQTALYDGVAAAVRAAGDEGQRDVLLLSDGKDSTDASLEDLVGQVGDSGVVVDAVSLEQSDGDSAALRRIVQAGKGELLDADDPSALAAAYAEEAAVLARQVLVTVQVPEGQTATDANVQVSLDAGGQTYTDTAFVRVNKPAKEPATAPASAPVPVESGGPAIPEPVVIGALVAVGLSLVTLIVLLFGGRRERPATLEDQIGTYGIDGRGPQPGVRRPSGEASGSLATQAREATAKALANNRSLEARIEQRLDAAGMSVKPAEWVLIHAGIAVAGGLLGGLLGAGNPLPIVLFLAVGAVGPWLYLGIKRSRRLAAFDSNLADTLQLMSGSLSAGLSLAQSLDTIVREGSEPVSSEFRRVIVESRLGVSLEDALEGVAERMDSKDFRWVVMAIRIQREVGGNLAELLLTVAATLREREYLRRHVRALSAEGRLSCWILGSLPPVFLAYLTLSKPDYVHPMFTTPLGWMMCVAMGVLLAVGIVWMSKVAKVEL